MLRRSFVVASAADSAAAAAALRARTFNADGIKKAASVLLIDRRTFKLLFVKRSASMKFMPDLHVFPGGKCDEADVQQADDLISPLPWAAERVSVLRELHEEVGVSVAADGGLIGANAAVDASAPPPPPFTLDFMQKLVPFSRWITPVQEVRRFDAAFFICPVSGPADAAGAASSVRLTLSEGEIAGAKWLTPQEAAAMHSDRGSGFKLPPPTIVMTHQLAQYKSVDALVEHYARLYGAGVDKMTAVAPLVTIDEPSAPGGSNLIMQIPDGAVPELKAGKHIFDLGGKIGGAFLKYHAEQTGKPVASPGTTMVLCVGEQA
jgi:8-oxo-dGTP pyrophosphatase MutT (NUDIX family)